MSIIYGQTVKTVSHKAKSESLDSCMTLIFSDGPFTACICPVILYGYSIY